MQGGQDVKPVLFHGPIEQLSYTVHVHEQDVHHEQPSLSDYGVQIF